MVPGFRYHVTTIIGIFVALGLGMLVGYSFVQPRLVQRQSELIVDLRKQFESQVAPLQDQNRHYSKFIEDMGSTVVAGRLTNMRVAVIRTGDYPDAVVKARRALTEAGATITGICGIDRTFNIKLQTQANEIRSKLQSAHPNGTDSDRTNPINAIADAITRGDSVPDLKTFAELGLIHIEDGEFNQSVDAVLLVGGSTEDYESRVDTVDLPLIEALKKTGVKVAYAEPENAGITYVPAIRNWRGKVNSDVPTLDNCDTDIGRIAIVFLLQAPAGDYGTKRTASVVFPTPATPR